MPKQEIPKFGLPAYLDKISKNPSHVGILTEGDSWFAFPLPSRPNIIDVLIKRLSGKAAWLRLEGNGDEGRIMQAGEQWERMFKVLSTPKARFHIILFSAGGNDIVGRCLLPLIRPRESWMSWQDCIHENRLQSRLNQIEGCYHELVALRDDLHPHAWIFTHDYDRVVPDGRPIRTPLGKIGPWMKPYLEARGIMDRDEQRQIMLYMLEQFSQRLRKLEQMYPRFYHVRTQGTLTEAEWGDEIHPTREGFEKIADRILTALCEEFPALKF